MTNNNVHADSSCIRRLPCTLWSEILTVYLQDAPSEAMFWATLVGSSAVERYHWKNFMTMTMHCICLKDDKELNAPHVEDYIKSYPTRWACIEAVYVGDFMSIIRDGWYRPLLESHGIVHLAREYGIYPASIGCLWGMNGFEWAHILSEEYYHTRLAILVNFCKLAHALQMELTYEDDQCINHNMKSIKNLYQYIYLACHASCRWEWIELGLGPVLPLQQGEGEEHRLSLSQVMQQMKHHLFDTLPTCNLYIFRNLHIDVYFQRLHRDQQYTIVALSEHNQPINITLPHGPETSIQLIAEQLPSHEQRIFDEESIIVIPAYHSQQTAAIAINEQQQQHQQPAVPSSMQHRSPPEWSLVQKEKLRLARGRACQQLCQQSTTATSSAQHESTSI